MKYITSVLTVVMVIVLAFSIFHSRKEKEEAKFENQYIKLNIAELYMVLNDDKMTTMHDMSYVFRGRVYLDSALEKSGYFGVLRVAMVCCAADTIAAGFRIPAKYLPEGTKNGDWVKVYGKAKRIGRDKEGETDLSDKASRTMSGSPISVSVRNDFIFVPDRVEAIDIPDDGYMYKWNQSGPYNY